MTKAVARLSGSDLKVGNRGVWEYVNASCIVDEIIFLAILSHPFEGKIVFFRRRKDGEKKRK